jgi:uncharacterized protein YdcH (DUF465 family)
MPTAKELAEKHKELSQEVDEMSQRKHLTPNEQKNLAVLKKLKLAYKDALTRDARLQYRK